MSAARPGLILLGAGRMGRLVHDAAAGAGYDLRAVVARHRPDWLDAALWREGMSAAPADAALLIDFSLPDGTLAAANWCAHNGVALLSGCTGLEASHEDALSRAAAVVPVLWAANFSPGVNLSLDLVARVAARAGSVQELTITDIHHAHKKDAPSGTALALGEASEPLQPRYESIREGEVVGEHRVRFQFAGETIEVTHRASDRGIFARGALEAGRWLLEQPAGRYSALDWLS